MPNRVLKTQIYLRNNLIFKSAVDELDDQKFQVYQDYVNKMKNMASETKEIENNMRQFTNIIKNIVTSQNAQTQNA